MPCGGDAQVLRVADEHRFLVRMEAAKLHGLITASTIFSEPTIPTQHRRHPIPTRIRFRAAEKHQYTSHLDVIHSKKVLQVHG
jgi:hypothetical protein